MNSRLRRGGAGPHPPFGRRPQALVVTDRNFSTTCTRWSSPSARRSDVAVALDLHELRRVSAALRRPGPSRQPHGRGALLRQQKFSLQPTARPARATAIPIAMPSSPTSTPSVSAALAAGQASDLGRYQEERTRRLLQECRTSSGVAKRAGEVRVHDFLIKELGRAVPYGIYYLASQCRLGQRRHLPTTPRPSRSRRFAAGGRRSAAPVTPMLTLLASPPTAAAPTALASACGNASCNVSPTNRHRHRRASPALRTSKCNKIEHRLFSFISQLAGLTVRQLSVIVYLISATTTSTGLAVRCELRHTYPSSPSPTPNGRPLYLCPNFTQ